MRFVFLKFNLHELESPVFQGSHGPGQVRINESVCRAVPSKITPQY